MKKIKKRYIILLIIAAIIGFFTYRSLTKKPQIEYVTSKVEKGQLVQTVSETGTVKAAKEFDLNFGVSGKIKSIKAKVGDVVKSGQVLAELDHSTLDLKIKEAQANQASAQANLAKVVAGATSESVAVSNAGVEQAEAAYDAAVKDLDKVKKTVNTSISQAEDNLKDLKKANGDITTYEQAYNVAQTNLNNTRSSYQRTIDNSRTNSLTNLEGKVTSDKSALDYIKKILDDTNAQPLFSIKDISYVTKTKNSKEAADELLVQAQASLAAAQKDSNSENVYLAIEDMEKALNKTLEALNFCFTGLTKSLTSDVFSQTTLDAYKTTINTHAATINTAISSVQASRQSINDAVLNYNNSVASAEKNLAQAQTNWDNAKISASNSLNTAKTSGDQQISAAQSRVETSKKAWDLARAQYEQTIAPTRNQDIAVAQSQVAQASLAVETVRKQIDDSIVKAPVEGVLTKSNYEIGEQYSASKPVFAMLGDHKFEIDVDVSEADIAKVRTGNPCEVTLDAFGEDIGFSGKVFFIDPAETVIQDVVYYRIKIDFDDKKYNIKSGMTANVTVTTQIKDDILKIPNRAILEKEGKRIVRILKNGQISESQVVIGLKGDEGMVEAVDGVAAGDELVVSTKTEK